MCCNYTTPLTFTEACLQQWLISKLGSKYILDKTVDGATPLHMAAGKSQRLNVFVVLKTSFVFNVALGHMEILKFFLDSLENRESINVQDHIHATPAHDAAEYGQTQAMLLLLKHGADITIKDSVRLSPTTCFQCGTIFFLFLKENKTPHELAVEQNHSEVAAMIADYRDNGVSALSKYEKKKSRRQRHDDADAVSITICMVANCPETSGTVPD